MELHDAWGGTPRALRLFSENTFRLSQSHRVPLTEKCACVATRLAPCNSTLTNPEILGTILQKSCVNFRVQPNNSVQFRAETSSAMEGISSGELRFQCVMCGRGYRSRSSLTRHSRYECGGLGSRYTFTCTLCGKYFCRPDHLKQHILNIHGGSFNK
ncbi:uncharacterized protein [Prorops nasuta]|uniref:uncharacterized protein n=1 Tax=Prorops nasuta TaxID=863751 RepID=UPI0034CE2628